MSSARQLTPKGQATRQRLLDIARDELAAHGSIEIAAVAERAGVAQSVLYRYFQGKDGLVEAVVHDFWDQYAAEVFDVPTDADLPWTDGEVLRLAREVHFLYTHPLGRAVATGLLHEAAATRACAIRQREQAQAATRNIRYGQRTGQLDPDIDAGLAGSAIIGALHAMLAEALGRDPAPAEHLVVDAAAQLGRALLPAPPA
ncbi:MAG TPA: TetR/AcrR family transcriptional regulator [Pseudonocardia sp.]|jgi:AcrR family transcriptional regulator|nr:TetR/AcrR family transcriptional regulator [Pseudonocardia sp.]